uniref:Uncharacterized protein n=1 Tax=Candidatus Kentrum sp. TC TaxID=2126339 RepID=A0A450YJ83_9GAMM|nr:MAG: hypothetical protein BECKTC1821E_GA0114239_101231 [Candidatus Kentron sp. TC]
MNRHRRRRTCLFGVTTFSMGLFPRWIERGYYVEEDAMGVDGIVRKSGMDLFTYETGEMRFSDSLR